MNEREKRLFQYGILFVFISVAIFAGFMNLGSVIAFIVWLTDIVMPIIIGCLIAVVLNAPMRGLQNLIRLIWKKAGKKPRDSVIDAASLVITLLGASLLIFLVFRIVVPQLIDSLKNIGDTFTVYYPKTIRKLKGYGVDTESIEELVNTLNLKSLSSQITDNASTIATKAFSAASSVLSTIFDIFTGIIIAVYLLAGKKKLKRHSKKLLYAYVRKERADKICEIASISNDTFFHFITGQCLEACILGLLFFITMSILRMPYASVISMFIGFMALIPYLGAFLGMVVGFLLILMVDPMQALGFAVMFLIIQQIEGQLIYPRVVGNSVGLPAIWTLLAALIGGSIFGIAGVLFFIPVTSVIYSLLKESIDENLRRKNIEIQK